MDGVRWQVPPPSEENSGGHSPLTAFYITPRSRRNLSRALREMDRNCLAPFFAVRAAEPIVSDDEK